MANIINNAGDGTITIAASAVPSDTTGKLYNVGGNIQWNGTDLANAANGDVSAPEGTNPGDPGDPATLAAGDGNATEGDGGDANIIGGAAVSDSLTIVSQDETNYDGAGSNGTFVAGDGVGGTAYVAADTITLSDGSVITVDSVDGNGDVLTFTVTTAGTTISAGGTLTQTSSSGSGTAFTLTPESNNITLFNNDGGDILLTPGDETGTGSAGAIIIGQTTAPTVTTDKLYNDGGALYWNGTDISSGGGGGIAAVVDDTTPQLGGSLDVNDFDIVGSPAATPSSKGNDINIVASNSGATTGAAVDGGVVNITGGDGYYGGHVNITGGGKHATYGGYGGTVTIAGGAGYKGDVSITTGASLFQPHVNIFGNVGSATAKAGGISITAGNLTSGSDSNPQSGEGVDRGGDIFIQAGKTDHTGDFSATGDGGDLFLRAGDGYSNGGSGDGGTIEIESGIGSSGGGNTGDIVMRMRDPVGTGLPGGINIIPTNASPPDTTDRLYNRANTNGGHLHWNGIDLTSELVGTPPFGAFSSGGSVSLAAGDGGATQGQGGDITLTTGTATGVLTAGYQEVDLDNLIFGGGQATGLANDATVYTASIIVDGGSSQPLSVVGSAAQDYTSLISELDTDTSGATWSLFDDNLYADSAFAGGAASTIAISDTDLFSTLTNFVAIGTATPGKGGTGAIIIPTQTAPQVTDNKLYNIAGALTWNGTDLTAGGGGISNVVEDTTPQLGGDLDVNGSNIVSADVASGTPTSIDIIAGSNAGYDDVGGNVNITGGAGTHPDPAGYGGDVNITSGEGTWRDGNVNIITPTNVRDAGNINIISGSSNMGLNSGEITIKAGNCINNATPGFIEIIGSDCDHGYASDQIGGRVKIQAGEGNSSFVGGELQLFAGDGDPTTSTGDGGGGSVSIRGGVGGRASGKGGPVGIHGGQLHGSVDGGIGDGGAVVITGANGGSTSGDGGDITLTSGYSTSGSHGAIVITSRPAAPTVTTNKLYNNGGALTWNGTDLTAGGGGGGLTVAVVAATSATTAAAQATMVDDDTAGSTVTITLLAGSANDQQVIKKLGTTANVIVDGDSAETIDGAATFTLTSQYASVTLIWNGTEWSII